MGCVPLGHPQGHSWGSTGPFLPFSSCPRRRDGPDAPSSRDPSPSGIGFLQQLCPAWASKPHWPLWPPQHRDPPWGEGRGRTPALISAGSPSRHWGDAAQTSQQLPCPPDTQLLRGRPEGLLQCLASWWPNPPTTPPPPPPWTESLSVCQLVTGSKWKSRARGPAHEVVGTQPVLRKKPDAHDVQILLLDVAVVVNSMLLFSVSLEPRCDQLTDGGRCLDMLAGPDTLWR